MKGIHHIFQLLEDFIFHENININKTLSEILKEIITLLKLRWGVIYIFPKAQDVIQQQTLILSHKNLENIFNIKGASFKHTFLYALKRKTINKLKQIKISHRFPEYNKNENIYMLSIHCCYFHFMVELAVKGNQKYDLLLLNTFMDYIHHGLIKHYRELYYQNKLNELLNLIEIGKLLNSTVHLDNLLDKLFNEVKQTMNTEGCSLMLMDNETGELKFKTVKGKKGTIIKEFTIPSGKGIAGWIVKHKKLIIVNNVSKDKRFYQSTDKMSGFKTKNLIGAPLIANKELIGVIEAVNRLNNKKFVESDKDIFIALANQAAIAIQNAKYYKELQDLFLNTVKSLSAAIDAKDKYTIGHSERVTQYSVLLAKEMELDSEMIKKVELAGLLHDIGKIGVDEKILQKPDRLNNEEYAIIKKHPVIGEEIIKPIPQLKEILSGIRNHHERWDGHGYPDNLEGENIPLLGRIISLGDTYDAMTSDRPYRKGMNLDLAIQEIQNCTGTQFDPSIAKVFIEVICKHEGIKK